MDISIPHPRFYAIYKVVVTVSQNRTVPVKLLNLGSAPIVLAKGKIIAKFTQLTNAFNVSHGYIFHIKPQFSKKLL
jgi:hypothetical protein